MSLLVGVCVCARRKKMHPTRHFSGGVGQDQEKEEESRKEGEGTTGCRGARSQADGINIRHQDGGAMWCQSGVRCTKSGVKGKCRCGEGCRHFGVKSGVTFQEGVCVWSKVPAPLHPGVFVPLLLFCSSKRTRKNRKEQSSGRRQHFCYSSYQRSGPMSKKPSPMFQYFNASTRTFHQVRVAPWSTASKYPDIRCLDLCVLPKGAKVDWVQVEWGCGTVTVAAQPLKYSRDQNTHTNNRCIAIPIKDWEVVEEDQEV